MLVRGLTPASKQTIRSVHWGFARAAESQFQWSPNLMIWLGDEQPCHLGDGVHEALASDFCSGVRVCSVMATPEGRIQERLVVLPGECVTERPRATNFATHMQLPGNSST